MPVIQDDTTRPRLCHLRKWPDFNCYGFNLHADMGKAGQYIGSIDKHSPADAGGLLSGDRIVEVNGMNISNEYHVQVVDRIKEDPIEVRLLVITPEGEEYYKAKSITVSSNMDNVIYCETPLTNPIGSDQVAMDDKYNLRLCKLHMWHDFDGYGFNIQRLEGRPGHFIGAIDQYSPAMLGGLEENDRILEVNHKDVTSMNHGEVVDLIRSGKNSVELLVVDPESEAYLTSRGIKLPSKLPHIIDCKGPQCNPKALQTPTNGQPIEVNSSLTKQNKEMGSDENFSTNHKGISSPSTPTGSAPQLACSAREARERMAKKKNIKDAGLSLMDKYQILQRL